MDVLCSNTVYRHLLLMSVPCCTYRILLTPLFLFSWPTVHTCTYSVLTIPTYFPTLPCAGVHSAHQADCWSEEGRCGQLQCAVLLADPVLHVLFLHTRESHQEIPHHAHQKVKGVGDSSREGHQGRSKIGGGACRR